MFLSVLGQIGLSENICYFAKVSCFWEYCSYFQGQNKYKVKEFSVRCSVSTKTLVLFLFVFNRGDTRYQGGLRSRELCQAPMVKVQALSSHSHHSLIWFCAPPKFLSLRSRPGIEPTTRRPIVTLNRRRPPELRHKGGAHCISYM